MRKMHRSTSMKIKVTTLKLIFTTQLLASLIANFGREEINCCSIQKAC